MEDEKLAEYYDDLTRRGGGAARFKQGLGFSGGGESTHDGPPPRGSALPTSSSFLSSFVKASDISKTSELEKQAQIQSIQNKLSKKSKERSNSSRRSRSRSRDRDRDIKRIRRSRSRERGSTYRSCSRERRSRRSRSREIGSRSSRYQSRSRSRDRDRERTRRKRSPEEIRNKGKTPSGNAVDYAKFIEGYDSMTPAQRVKAKMKLQLSETAEHDKTLGKGAGWERFEFNKDAPLDDEEVEAAEDDAAVVKHMGQSFRFSAVEAKREQEIKNVHDEAIFGGASFPLPTEVKEDAESYPHSHRDDNDAKSSISSLLSNQIVTMQQKGSWRDRVGKS